MAENRILVQKEDFVQAAEQRFLEADDATCGAVVTFCGLVRNNAAQNLAGIFLEHYPGMTENTLCSVVQAARARWELGNISLIHRIGHLRLGEQIVYVGVASAHRQAAFEAAVFIMDILKTDVPLWKKELSETGDLWVAQKEQDLAAAGRW